jgi:hypothetical protein
MEKKTTISLLLIIVIVGFSTTFTAAQSLIAGIPSADVAPENVLMFTHESQLNVWKYDKIKWNSFNFFCYGIQKNLEFTASFSNLSNSPVAHESIGVGFKKIIDVPVAIPECKFIFGQNVLFGLSEKTTVGGWSYSMFSFRTPKLKTRLTAGLSFGSAELFGYDTISVKNEAGILQKKVVERNPLSFMGGLEQPIIDNKLILIADWFSGTHDLSALIVGTQFNFKHIVLITGYKFVNHENVDAGSAIVELMYEF